jgi:hypothetical protein
VISRFFGIVIRMYFDEHGVPHFHAIYGSDTASFAVETLVLLEGNLPPRVRGFVVEWAAQHQDELLANWMRARQQQPLLPIAPLT